MEEPDVISMLHRAGQLSKMKLMSTWDGSVLSFSWKTCAEEATTCSDGL